MDFLFTLFPNPESNFPLLAVILGLPLLGALVNGIFGKRLGPQAVSTMATTAVFGAFAAAVLSFIMLWGRVHEAPEGQEQIKFVWNAWRWLATETTAIDVAFSIDQLSAVMMLVVTGVGGLIHLYATGYMAGDPSYHRFFAYLNLFIFAMLVLVLGDNLPILFVGWEGVGLCSYLLIGFWFESDKNAAAGKKAFITNRIGDFGLLVGMAMLLYYTGSLSFSGIHNQAAQLMTDVQIWPIGDGLRLPDWQFLQGANDPVMVSGATLVGLALFLGCAGKSAQIPLYVWLPDAMAGPTPVSALIHAATMVTAGVYLVARMSFVFVLSPTTMMVVAGVGAATALFAATIGIVQNDIKKVLAYSTVSQLGFMFMAVGVGAFSAGIFHVFTHAFFKACLFLCAGSVIHAMHVRIHDTDASQDMRNMGGLRKYMPTTFWTYAAATAAIIGLPFMSGFFSKDDILFRTFINRIYPTGLLEDAALREALREAGKPLTQEASAAVIASLQTPVWFHWMVFLVGLTAAILTAFYMVRSLLLTFYGDFRGWKIVAGWREPHVAHGHPGEELEEAPKHHEHPGPDLQGPVPKESPWPMTVPLIVLALGAVFAGYLNAGPLHFTPMANWLAPVFATGSKAVHTIVEGPELFTWELWFLIPGTLAFVVGAGAAWWVYQVRKGEPARQAAGSVPRLHRLVLDKWRIDELYDATVIGWIDSLAETSMLFDKHIVDGVIGRLIAAIVRTIGSILRVVQNGRVQMYAAAMVIGLVVMGSFFMWPQTAVVVQANNDTGQYEVQASPGLGYEYRWDVDGDGEWDQGDTWTLLEKSQVQLERGESKKVRLQVRNVFQLTDEREIELTRPRVDGGTPQDGEPMGMRQ